MTKKWLISPHLRHTIVGANNNKQWRGEGEKVASFQSDGNGSTNPLKMSTDRDGIKRNKSQTRKKLPTQLF